MRCGGCHGSQAYDGCSVVLIFTSRSSCAEEDHERLHRPAAFHAVRPHRVLMDELKGRGPPSARRPESPVSSHSSRSAQSRSVSPGSTCPLGRSQRTLCFMSRNSRTGRPRTTRNPHDRTVSISFAIDRPVPANDFISRPRGASNGLPLRRTLAVNFRSANVSFGFSF